MSCGLVWRYILCAQLHALTKLTRGTHAYTPHGPNDKGKRLLQTNIGIAYSGQKTPSYTAFLSDTIVQNIHAVLYLWIIVSHSISLYAIVNTTATFEHLSQYVVLYYIRLDYAILYCTTISYYSVVYEYTCVFFRVVLYRVQLTCIVKHYTQCYMICITPYHTLVW